MSKTVQYNSSQMGLGGWVFLLFLGLKLGHVINWSWWWVTAPLWIPAALAALIFAVGGTIMLLAATKR